MATKGTSGNDMLTGSKFKDKLFGLGGNDIIKGLAGNDLLEGGTGNDKLYGDTGMDILKGGSGDDRLFGGKNADVLTGGSGKDTFVFSKGDGKDTITDFTVSGKNKDLIKLYGYNNLKKDADVLKFAKQVKKDVVIDLGGGNKITLKDVKLSDLKKNPGDHFDV